MAHIIQVRQRIRNMETIIKITNAMRLISMSTHMRLKGRQAPLIAYKNAVQSLFNRIHQHVPDWTHDIAYPPSSRSTLRLVILTSSSKGLCGPFNNALFKFFDK